MIHTNRFIHNPVSSISSSQSTFKLKSSSKTYSYSGIDLPRSFATLIICPLNLIAQWRDEVERCFSPGQMTATFYYGDGREQTSKNEYSKIKSPTVIITTYGTLSSEWEHHCKTNSSSLYSIYWHRIVLDEAHYIKGIFRFNLEKATKAAKACYNLNGQNRWAVTGTPIVNKLDDFFSLVHFLKVDPWSQYSFWNSFITIPFEKRDPAAIQCVQTIMEPLILRRTKDMKDSDGNPIVDLPQKTVTIDYLDFGEKERELYNEINQVIIIN